MRIRSILIGEITAKLLRRSCYKSRANVNLGKKKIGEAVVDANVATLMSVDTSKVLEVTCYIYYIVSTPLAIMICVSSLLSVNFILFTHTQ